MDDFENFHLLFSPHDAFLGKSITTFVLFAYWIKLGLLESSSLQCPSHHILVHTHTAKMGDLKERLAALNPTIQELMKIAGTAGLSLGILYKGEPIYHANFGYRDVKLKLPVTEETIFPACSLTTAMISEAAGMLIEEGNLTWDTLIKDLLPGYDIKDDILRTQTTLTDLLSHRTGMSTGDYYLGSDNNILISKADGMKFINDQEPVRPFRAQWQYNNLGYELAGRVIDMVSGTSWADVLESRIIDPLGMDRTFTCAAPKHLDNVAKAYCTLDDATPVEIHTIKAGADTFSGSGAGVSTCVKDLLKHYSTLIKAAHDQFKTGKTSGPHSPLKQVNHILSAKIPMSGPSFGELSYALGWARVQLPGPMGHIGYNPSLMPEGMPFVGKGASSRLVLYHQGSLPGALSAVILIPDIQSAIVVMSNSLALNDCTDWVSQLVLEELLEVPDRNDYIKAARTSAAESLRWYPDVMRQLAQDKTPNTTPKPCKAYEGTYWNSSLTMKIEVVVKNKGLYWEIQGLESERFLLHHYENDVFTWLQPRNEMAKRGRWVDQGVSFWKVEFRTNDQGFVDRLVWVHDSERAVGEEFFKISL